MKRELSPEAQAIVDAAREADGPSEADRKRVKGAVMAAIATGAVGGGGVGGASAHAASSGGVAGAAGVALKVLGAAVIVAGLAAGGYLAFDVGGGEGGGDRLSDPAPVSVPDPAPVSVPDPDPVSDPVTDSDPVSKDEQRDTDTEPEPEPEQEKGAPRQESSLAAERELLSKARRAFEEGAPKRALRLLDDYARRFRGGVLLEERAAIRILALCDLGKTQRARRAAKRFAAKWPRSIYGDRIQSSCAAP